MLYLAAINDSSPCPAASRCRAVSPLVLPSCTSSPSGSAAAFRCRTASPLVLPRCPPSSSGPGCNYPTPGQHALKAVIAVAAAAVTVVTAAAVAAAAAATVVTTVAAATSKTVAVVQTGLWGLPKAPAYPGKAAVTVTAESSCSPEVVPPQTVFSGAPK